MPLDEKIFIFVTMSVKTCNPKILERNERVRRRYRQLTEEENLKSDYVLQRLEDEFLPLNKTTLWLIVSQTGYYKDK